MSYWSFDELVALWGAVHGDPSRGPLMAAIATAESSGESDAVSPAGALSLWQLMPFWAAYFGQGVWELSIPLVNAADAKGISGNGFHVGAWDTCYNPPSSAAVRRDLTWAEQGSPAWNILNGRGGNTGATAAEGAYAGASSGDMLLINQFNQANYYNRQTIPYNTGQVRYNIGYRPGRRSPVIV